MYQNKWLVIESKTPRYILLWLSFIIFLLFSFFLSLCIPFKQKQYYMGFVTKIENEYYVKIYSSEKEVGKLNRKNVWINEKSYPLAYTKIKEAYTIDASLDVFHEVYLSVSLPKELKIENNKVEVYFEGDKTTLFRIILQKLEKDVYETIKE